MPAKLSEILVRTKELIDEEDKWTKGASARDENGVDCSVIGGEHDLDGFEIEPVCFCLTGAATRATFEYIMEDFGEFEWRYPEDDEVIPDLCYNLVHPHMVTIMRKAVDGVQYITPEDFNDEPYTSHRDMMKALDAMIKEAKTNDVTIEGPKLYEEETY